MESESIKRSSSVKIQKLTASIVEGTSVTPRQRPKGQGVATGPISLSGQMVSQISGQGNSSNQASYVQINQQMTPINISQAYAQQSLHASQSFTHVPANISSSNQANTTIPQSQSQPLFNQSQSPLSNQSPLTQQSPNSVLMQEDHILPGLTRNDGNLEALFPSSSNFQLNYFLFLFF